MFNFIRKYWLIISFSFLFIVSINSCFIVIYPEKSDIAQELKLTPKPELEMSDELIRSPKGDIISLAPIGFFLMDLNSKLENNVFSALVNSKYNAAIVFSEFITNEQTEKVFQEGGLIALARLSFDKRKNNSDAEPEMAGKYQIIKIGDLEFASYSYTTNKVVNAKTAICRSRIGNIYEISVMPMLVNNNPIPEQIDIDKTFLSVLASIKY